MSYLSRFLDLRCAPELLPFFQATSRRDKEIEESMSLWVAARKYLLVTGKENLVAIVVGDGRTPRTAALLAHLTSWDCHSIDPQLDLNWYETIEVERARAGSPIKRLSLHRCKAEEMHVPCDGREAIVFMPHSHASVVSSLRVPATNGTVHAIAMPCCVPAESWTTQPGFSQAYWQFEDANVRSKKNTVHVWKNVKYRN
jgi:hypothetical protein